MGAANSQPDNRRMSTGSTSIQDSKNATQVPE